MSLDEIHEHRARSETWKHTWSREYSPWTTDFEAMVRKTAVRQLEKWVPTSTEYREQQFRLAEQARAQEVKPEPRRRSRSRLRWSGSRRVRWMVRVPCRRPMRSLAHGTPPGANGWMSGGSRASLAGAGSQSGKDARRVSGAWSAHLLGKQFGGTNGPTISPCSANGATKTPRHSRHERHHGMDRRARGVDCPRRS